MEGQVMDGWLHCVVSPGQFSGEHGVEVRTSAGEVFLFAPAEEIELPAGAQSDYNGEAHIHVEIIEQKGDLLLVRLPRRTLENGQHITVRQESIRQEA